MKHTFTLILLVLSLFFTINLQAQCDFDGDFENWEMNSFPVSDTDTATVDWPVGWISFTEILNFVLFGDTSTYVGRTTDAYSGDLAASISTVGDGSGADLSTIVACDQMTTKVSGYYKLRGSNSSASIQFIPTQYFPAMDTSLPVGAGMITLPPVATYTYFEFDVTYQDPDAQPDTALLVIIAASTGGVIGELIIDEIRVEDTSPVDEQLADQIGLRVYPNPVADRLYFESESGEPGRITVYDLTGREVIHTRHIYPGEQLSLSQLVPGSYLARLQQGEAVRVSKLVKE